ncbi:MAG: FAD-dependent oxidoreductase, partial [Nitratireductor sp.]
MSETFDVVIIGSGPGGYVCAIKAAQLGLKTAIVEKMSTFGGTCLNVGCIPSKALLHASEMYHEAEHGLEGLGVNVGKPKLDLKKMMAHKDATIKSNVDGVQFLLKKNKVTTFHGTGSIAKAGEVVVSDEKGKTQSIATKNIVIATGSSVAGIPGVEVDIDEKTIVSSTGALELTKVPKHLVVVGGG